MPLLEVKDITKNFGGIQALSSVSLHVNAREILGLIGPNGAGKSTLFNVISGVYHCDSGKVFFNGEDITGRRPDLVAQKGLVRTFQQMVLWRNLSVMNCMRAALHMSSGFNVFGGLFDTASYRQKETKVDEEAMTILEFVGMEHLQEQQSGTLSHGYQRTLSLAIGAATRPPLLLLDEPVTALNPERVAHIMDLLRRLRQQGTTILIVEHNMRAIFDICDRIVVLNAGCNIAEGAPQDIRENKEVIAAYLGGGRLAG
ncbi:ABC transporter ATP-binding protein [Chloroflexota bacterium]